MTASLIKKLKAINRSPLTGRKRRWVPLEEVLAIVRQHDAGRNSPVLATPTERMCDGARGFIMGLDLNCRTWAAMETHLDSGGYDCLPYIRQKAKETPKGHITKWDVADCIWQLMQRYRPVSYAMDVPTRKDGNTEEPAKHPATQGVANSTAPVMGDASARKDEGSAGTTALPTSASRLASSPASEAYRKVLDALGLQAAGINSVELCTVRAREALAALATLKPQPTADGDPFGIRYDVPKSEPNMNASTLFAAVKGEQQ